MPQFFDDFAGNYARYYDATPRVTYDESHRGAGDQPRIHIPETQVSEAQASEATKTIMDWYEEYKRKERQRVVQQCIELIPYFQARRNQIENQIFLLEKGGYEMWPDIKSLKDQLARNQERLNTRLRAYRILTGEDYAG